MTESNPHSPFREKAHFLAASRELQVMRCYFMRAGHIARVEELSGLSDEEATTKAHALFSERERAKPWWRRLAG
jgi:hypothetical protein